MKAFLLLMLLAAAPPSECAHRYTEAGMKEATMHLELGMTSGQVLGNLGEPNTQEAAVCGEATAQPWKCIIWTYHGYGDTPELRIYLSSEGNALLVNRWDRAPEPPPRARLVLLVIPTRR